MGLLSDNKMKSDYSGSSTPCGSRHRPSETQIGSLSGGNQQKVIIGRWLLTQPES